MKKILILAIILIALNTSCSQEATVEPIEVQNDIQTVVDKTLEQSNSKGERFFKVNNLKKDESIKINLVKYEGTKKSLILDGLPKKMDTFYIKIDGDKFSYVEIKDINKGLVGDYSTYKTEDDFLSVDNKVSVYDWLDEKMNLDKKVVLFQCDISNSDKVIFNTYDNSSSDKNEDNTRDEENIKNQFGYAVVISKVKDDTKDK